MKKYLPSLKILTKKIPSIRALTDGHPKIFFIAAIICVLIIGLLDRLYNPEFIDILVEAHGLLFDIILFGVLLSIYESLTQRKNRIRHYLEEIDDFRSWHEPEATYRIVGNIKRLNREGVYKINLQGAYLFNADLNFKKLNGSYFFWANLSEAFLGNTELEDANLMGTKLRYTRFVKTNLKGADFTNAILDGTFFNNSDIRGTDFSRVKIENLNSFPPQFEGAKAYKSQKEILEKLGINVSEMIWEDDPF